MNVRAIANRATRGINPNIAATVRVCTGYTTAANGKQVPAYVPPVPVTIQAQALAKKEVEHLDSMNLSNATRAIYADTQLTGVDRITRSGGDIVSFADPTGPFAGIVYDWLVIAVLEDWSTAGWCKVALAEQMLGHPQ